MAPSELAFATAKGQGISNAPASELAVVYKTGGFLGGFLLASGVLMGAVQVITVRRGRVGKHTYPLPYYLTTRFERVRATHPTPIAPAPSETARAFLSSFGT